MPRNDDSLKLKQRNLLRNCGLFPPLWVQFLRARGWKKKIYSTKNLSRRVGTRDMDAIGKELTSLKQRGSSRMKSSGHSMWRGTCEVVQTLSTITDCWAQQPSFPRNHCYSSCWCALSSKAERKYGPWLYSVVTVSVIEKEKKLLKHPV
jgi:hypothetical protein